ncbi:CHAD domain-containing protein [Laspinema olomoucense]|uniref:CHAD domain-containing protein n=1 Tax=Laspinema olomoucense D3b TaxID=2953688 RepID=A0ABT2N8E4_9CYAN|nr:MULTISPECIES: CHAD domain-containing protein [unclassified Laspinema]MCT7973862.1 CHAD domain-containing protein [Laspinema sp. D3d]MCT7978948.1 CHAD domain-containing protein [Laspinema sp. D3b]MCT7989687.1 CHAD domain-containing protein [Laspinema sp. D3a]
MKSDSNQSANTVGDWAKIALEKHFQTTIQYEEDVLSDRDPEALHQMRVGMRRLRSVAKGFAPALDLPKAARQSQIGQISRSLGSLRDLDVLLETLETDYQDTLPDGEQEEFKRALTLLKFERNQAFDAVRETLNSEIYLSFKNSLAEWLNSPSFGQMALLPIQHILPDLLLPAVSELFLHPGWLLGIKTKKGKVKSDNLTETEVQELFAHQGETLHDLRKQVKRVRYQMSLFTKFYGEAYSEYVEDLKEIQEVLGKMQDSVVLAETLSRVLGSALPETLPTLAEKLLENRYLSWLEWQPLHQQYLKPQIRDHLRLELLYPIPSSKSKKAGGKKKKS